MSKCPSVQVSRYAALLTSFVVTVAVTAAPGGQTRGQSGPGVEPLPELAAPPGAEIQTRVAYGLRSTLSAGQELPATGMNYRLTRAPAVAATTEHYVARLSALGWKQTYRGSAARLGLARFSAGSADDPRTGILAVVPFESNGQTIIAIRLVLARATWNAGRRAGGAGANAAARAVFTFRGLVEPLTLPEEVTRVEERTGGGPADFRYGDARLQTTLAPAALMARLEKQIASPQWRRDALLGDAGQSVLRRSMTKGPVLSELWMLTRMPGVLEVDAMLLAICAQPRDSSKPLPSPRPVRPVCG